MVRTMIVIARISGGRWSLPKEQVISRAAIHIRISISGPELGVCENAEGE